MIKAIIFDLDGTLVDSVKYHAEAWVKAFKEYGYDFSQETLSKQIGKGSEFIVTGKGGIAPSPMQARDGEINEIDLVEPMLASEAGEQRIGEAEVPKGEIVEARGLIINDKGILELVAHQTDTGNFSPQLQKLCP